MDIALIGTGKMGKLVEQLAVQRGHRVIGGYHPLQDYSLDGADVCIDFSHPGVVMKNIELVADQGKNLVMGTTGWESSLDQVKEIVERSGIGFLYSPNFSIGVHLFMEIVKNAMKTVETMGYDIAGLEMHHNEKVDAPSGTAKELEKITGCKFSSVRCGSIPGTHSIIMDSPIDTITLTHEARSRSGFAEGAIRAAEWLEGKKGFYTIEDLLK